MPAQKVAHQGGVTVMKSERSSNKWWSSIRMALTLNFILTGTDISVTYAVIVREWSPFIIKPFQFPGIDDVGGIIIIDGRHIHGECVLVVFQLDETGFVQNFCQRRILFHRVHRMIHDVQVREYHVAGKAWGQFQTVGQNDDTFVASQKSADRFGYVFRQSDWSLLLAILVPVSSW